MAPQNPVQHRRSQKRAWASVRRVCACSSLILATAGWYATPALATGLSPALRAEAHRLYAPVKRFEGSITKREAAEQQTLDRRFSDRLKACRRPYEDQLYSPHGRRANELLSLWMASIALESYQIDTRSVAKPLRRLADTWATVSLHNPAMNHFVRGFAGGLHATLNAGPFNGCAFVRAIGRHHFSYAWAKRSSWGVRTTTYWKQVNHDAARDRPFWRRLGDSSNPNPPTGVWAGLFSRSQVDRLVGLPGPLP